MKHAICCVPVSPVRAEPSHKSEMVSQLLFGEGAGIIEEAKDFYKVQCLEDGYEGWCQKSQLVVVDQLPDSQNLYTGNWSNTVFINNIPAQISLGSPVIATPGADSRLGGLTIRYADITIWDAKTGRPTAELLTNTASRFLNTPYLWGGRSVFGIDCSGFSQLVFRLFNKQLPRDAWQQANEGEAVGFLQEVHCGDLAFFDNEEGRITHVGILLNHHEIIHAAGKVRIDKIDNAGIVNTDTKQRTHKLRVIKRFWS